MIYRPNIHWTQFFNVTHSVPFFRTSVQKKEKQIVIVFGAILWCECFIYSYRNSPEQQAEIRKYYTEKAEKKKLEAQQKRLSKAQVQ